MHGEMDLPLGLVFPKPLEMHRVHLEAAALSIRGGGEKGTTGQEKNLETQKPPHGLDSIHVRPGRVWLCNVEFDLTLATRALPPKLAALSRQMAWHFWPALDGGDQLLVSEKSPPDFREYLESLGFSLPTFTVKADPSRLFTPFGWNREAAGINAQQANPASHPEIALVAKVNSREFSSALESELFPEESDASRAGAFFRNEEDLSRWIGEAHPGRWVAKGNHGHGGVGQMRFHIPGPEVAAILGRILKDHAGLAVESEHDLAVEFGVLFRLFADGSRSEIRCHRLLSRSGGGYIGALKVPADPEIAAWLPSIEKSVKAVALRLHAEGYFGPVSLDMYAHRDGEKLRFRSLVDLNARCSMAYPVHGFSHRLPDRAVQVFQFPAKTLRRPETLGGFRKELGVLHYDPATERGVFWVTPLLPGMIRHTLAFVGRDEEDLREIRSRVLPGVSHA